MHDKPRAWISFYNKGEIVAALLDLEMRRLTSGRRSLDDLMRQLWTRYARKGRGLEEDAIRKAVVSVTGKDLSHFFDKYVDGVEPLPYEQLFGAAGIQVGSDSSSRRKLRGVVLKAAPRLTVVSSPGGSELRAGDEIVAVSGRRVTSETALATALKTVEAEMCELTISRADALLVVRAAIDSTTVSSLRLSLSQSPTAEQSALLENWLGAPSAT